MKSNKLKDTIEYCGLSYKKEVMKIASIIVLSIAVVAALYVFTEDIKIAAIGMTFGIMLTYLFVSNYSSKKNIIQGNRNDEFVSLINNFQCFLNNKNNVYQSFRKLENFSSMWMSSQIRRFLEHVDVDKSVKPYIDFSMLFTISSARDVMLSIFQMVEQGESSLQLQQFKYTFSQLNEATYARRRDKFEKSLNTSTVFPMVGSGLLMISLTLCILESLGDLTNVI